MDNMAIYLGILALVLLVINLRYTLLMTSFLKDRGQKINYPLLHVKAIDYAKAYHSYKSEEGMNPAVYNGFVISGILFFGTVFLGIFLVS